MTWSVKDRYGNKLRKGDEVIRIDHALNCFEIVVVNDTNRKSYVPTIQCIRPGRTAADIITDYAQDVFKFVRGEGGGLYSDKVGNQVKIGDTVVYVHISPNMYLNILEFRVEEIMDGWLYGKDAAGKEHKAPVSNTVKLI